MFNEWRGEEKRNEGAVDGNMHWGARNRYTV